MMFYGLIYVIQCDVLPYDTSILCCYIRVYMIQMDYCIQECIINAELYSGLRVFAIVISRVNDLATNMRRVIKLDC